MRKQTLPVSFIRKTWTAQEARLVLSEVAIEPLIVKPPSGPELWCCVRCYHDTYEGAPHCDRCKQSFDLTAWQERVAKREGRLV
jgi:hypothetical protein